MDSKATNPRVERPAEGSGKCVPGAPNPKPQRDAPVFSQRIEEVETGRDVPVVCGDDGGSVDELDAVDWLPADLLVVTAFRKYLVKNSLINNENNE